MKVSVIIPTYNGVHKLPHILKCLELQNELPDETLIVIDGSTDGTEDYLKNGGIKLPEFRVITQANGGRAKVRNRGAKEASGDLLIFFDDDMLPEAECIAIHKQHHLLHQDSILTGAQIDVCTEEIKDIRKYKSFLTRKWAEPIKEFAQKPIQEKDTFITAANFSVSKLVFESLSGFDERLTDAEDYDLAVRAVEKGVSLYYNHEAFAWHDDQITCLSYIRRQRQYALAQITLNQLHEGRINKYSTNIPKGAKGLFFKLFCYRGWIDSIDNNLWTYLLPKSLRYKLYDWVITANATYFPKKVKL